MRAWVVRSDGEPRDVFELEDVTEPGAEQLDGLKMDLAGWVTDPAAFGIDERSRPAGVQVIQGDVFQIPGPDERLEQRRRRRGGAVHEHRHSASQLRHRIGGAHGAIGPVGHDVYFTVDRGCADHEASELGRDRVRIVLLQPRAGAQRHAAVNASRARRG